MAKARSPEYPSISLKEAIERVKMIYDKDYQNRLPKKVIAEHMGYKGISGASLPVLAALSKYGLLEGRGDETRVSELAVRLIAHAPGTPERMAALKEASGLPELFAELDERFQNGKASDQAIRSYLLTQKFIPAAADAAIRSYRDTKSIIEAESVGYPGGHNREPEMPEPPEDWGKILGPKPPPGQRDELDDPDGPPPPGVRKTVFVLPEGDVVVTFPEGMSAQSADDLKAYIDIWLRQIQRDAKSKKDDAAN